MINTPPTHTPVVKLGGERFTTPKRGIEVAFNKIYTALINKDSSFNDLSLKEQQNKMSFVNLAYTLAKAKHRDQERLDGTRYFDHIKGVGQILISEFDNITYNQTIAAFLHDIIEDTDITLETIENLFGKEIARMVDAVTKKPDEYYLWPDERTEYDVLSTKEEKEAFLKNKSAVIKSRRTEHYFGHMKDLDEETLQVKFADRLHNLRDLGHCSEQKVKDQIEETQKYLLPIALEKNPTAYKLLTIELEKLHNRIYGNTDKFKEYLADILSANTH